MSIKRDNDAGKLGLFGAINVMVGSMLGAAIYILLPQMIDGVGSGLFLAFLIGALPAVFCSVYYIQLNATFPRSGGSYYFSKRLLGSYVGFISSICLIFSFTGGMTMLANGFSQYFSVYFPSIPIVVPLIGVVVLFFVINTLGIQMVKVIQTIMVISILIALTMFVVPGLMHHYSGAGLEVPNEFLPGGGGALFSASVTAFMGYATFVYLSSLGGNIKNPKRNTPIAMIVGVSTVATVFATVSYTATLVAPKEMISQSTAVLPDVASLYLPTFMTVFIGVSGLLAIATTLNTTFTVTAAELQNLSEEKHLPKKLSEKHKKSNTPINSLLLAGFVTLILLSSGLPNNVFMHMAFTGILLSVFITGIAALRLRTKAKEEYENASIQLPLWLLYPSIIIGGILSLSYAVFVLYSYPVITGMLLLYLAIGNGFYFYYRRSNSTEAVLEEVDQRVSG